MELNKLHRKEKNKLNLDVGCGLLPKGDINVDLFIEEYSSRKKDLKKLRIPNLINADIHFLPFRDKAFNTTFCYNVLEHIEVEIIYALRELVRVTENILEIQIPHRFAMFIEAPRHNKAYGVLSFRKLLKSLGFPYCLDVYYKDVPFSLLPLVRIPNRIRVRISCGEF